MMSLMAFFVLSFFQGDVFDEIWDLIRSVSEGFPTYSFIRIASGIQKFYRKCVLVPADTAILVDLIERIFKGKGSLYIPCNDRHAFFTSDAVRYYNLWSCQKVCEALTFLLDNIYIRFDS